MTDDELSDLLDDVASLRRRVEDVERKLDEFMLKVARVIGEQARQNRNHIPKENDDHD
jgi:hypothetical protein